MSNENRLVYTVIILDDKGNKIKEFPSVKHAAIYYKMYTKKFRNKKIYEHRKLSDGNYAVYGEKCLVLFDEIDFENPYDKIIGIKNNIGVKHNLTEVYSVIILDKDNNEINKFSTVRLAATHYRMNTDIFRNKKINFHKRLRDGNYAVYGEKHHISFKNF